MFSIIVVLGSFTNNMGMCDCIYEDNRHASPQLLKTYVKVAGSASPGTIGAWRWSPAMAKRTPTQDILL